MDLKNKIKTLTQIEKLENLTPRTIWYLQNLIPEQHWSLVPGLIPVLIP
jgi:hypothetical protein